MKKWVKKSIPLVVATSMAFSVIPGAVDAKSNNGKGNGKGNGNNKQIEQFLKAPINNRFNLKDVEQHWANQDIYKMYSLGIMSGYDDFTYQPNKPVTQLEAISSLVRVLELDDKDRNPSLSNKNLKDIPSWAKNTVAIAIEENLIDGKSKFQPNKPATRLFITNLLVKLVGTDIDDYWEEANPLFKDVDNLSKEEKAILAFATLTKLISGYNDQTFQPNKPVTRAEMAVLINRLLDYKEDLGDYYNQSGKGTIAAIDEKDSEITIKQRVRDDGEWKYVNKEYSIDEDAKIYVNSRLSSLSKLTTNMSVEFTIDDDDDIIYLSATSVSDDDEAEDYDYEGVITKIDDNIVWAKVDLVNLPLLIDSNVKITTKSGAKGDIDDLKVDQKISFNLNSSGDVTEIFIDVQLSDDDISDEESDLLEELGELNKIDLEIEGDDDTKIEIFFERESNNTYEAQIKIVTENNRFDFSGKSALTFLANFIENENINFSDDDEAEVDEFIDDLINEYNISDAKVDGVIVIDEETFNL